MSIYRPIWRHFKYLTTTHTVCFSDLELALAVMHKFLRSTLLLLLPPWIITCWFLFCLHDCIASNNNGCSLYSSPSSSYLLNMQLKVLLRKGISLSIRFAHKNVTGVALICCSPFLKACKFCALLNFFRFRRRPH